MGSKVQTFFSEEGHAAYKIKGNKYRKLCKIDIMHTPGHLGWVKRSDIEIVQISIF